ncbi:MAG TPA: ABC transporter ATP-binding protein/permease [Firmicutes bacterium]|nr:ABC transporter ATP-binding protein/permease [Bacillota bacterium]
MPEPRGMPGRGPMGGPPRGGPHGPMVREKPKNAAGTLKRLVIYIGKNKYLLMGLLVVMLAVTLLSLAGPALQADAIDAITITDSRLQVDFQGLFKMLVLLGITYVLSSVFTYFQGIFAAKLSQTTVRNMRADLFSKIERLPIRYLDTHQHGDIMSRMTNDVENVSNTISQSIASLFSSVLTILGTLVIMLSYNPLMTLVSIVTVPLSLLASVYMSRFMRKYFLRQQTLLGNLNGHIEEMVTGYKTVMAYGREARAVEEFSEISGNLKNCSIRAQIFGGIMGPLMNFIGNFGYLLIAAVGGYMALHGVITVGVIQAFLIYSKQFTRPISEVANQYAQILTAMAGAERVFAVMDHPSEDAGGDAPVTPENVRGDLSFRHIDFSYIPGEQVLKDFQLEVKSGQKIAIVGATGSGKTTVVNLLTRFYDVDGGEILLDGVNIRDIPKDNLRRSIAIVLQDTVLFSDTVAANIRYGRLDASMEEVKAAAAAANADLFIEQLPEGYDTVLSESGGNLSGGQRQLLSIARAVLANPKILILDEATSSVDTRTEMHIQQAMIALMQNRTSLIIAHRLSTIRDADKIIVIDGGRVAESGSHEELLEKKGCYYRLYQNQFAGKQI